MIHSQIPLNSEEENLLSDYFSRYEFAIDINKAMRREAPVRLDAGEAREYGRRITRTIAEKGLRTTGNEVWYRSMDRGHLSPEDLVRAQSAPIGVPVTCLVTVASTLQGASFGSAKYAIALPAGERYIRNSRYELGVGHWSEYLLGPGMIWHFGNYYSYPLPVMYTSKEEDEITPEIIKDCLRRAGMKFKESNVEALAILRSGRVVPVISSYGTGILPTDRYIVTPWGVEETNQDGTLSIFDIRRVTLNQPGRISELLKKKPVSTETYNGIEYRFF